MGTDPPRDDLSLELVQRVQAGDRSAWEALYLRYRDRLLFAIRSRLGPALRSRLQSEDILHSVVREVIASALTGFEPRGPRSLERYLHTCVLNKICAKAAYHGARKRADDVPLSDSILERLPNAAGASPTYIDADRYEQLERAMGTLPEPMREVVLLRGVEGLSNLEAARVMGKSAEATSKLYNRAIARLGVATLGRGALP